MKETTYDTYVGTYVCISKEWTTPDFRNTPSTTNLEEKEIVDVPGKDGNASMPEQVERPNPWRKMMMMTKRIFIYGLECHKVLTSAYKS
jgi:hypothetical protein